MTRYSGGLLQFFGNGSWNSVDQGSTGVSCTTPGGFRFNTGTSRAEFCNGTTWRSMDSGISAAGSGSAGMTRYSDGQFQFHNGSGWVVGGTAPLHRWKMDETSGTSISDTSPNPLNGTFSGAANVTSEASAVIDTGIVYDGSDDIVSVNNTGNIFQTVPFTWSLWVKFDSLPSSTGGPMGFLRMRHSVSPWYSYYLYLNHPSNIPRFTIKNSGGTDTHLDGNAAVETNRWYHFVVSVDASYGTRLYIDGVLQKYSTGPGSLYAANGDIKIGANNGVTDGLDGRMDDTRFYSRVLSEDEVSALFWEGYQPATKIIALTSGSTWTVPSDWNSANNSVEVIGGGGGGANGTANQGATGGGRFGGGGGAYSITTNVSLTPNSSVAINVGLGGSAGSAGGDTYFCNSTSNCASIAGTAVVVGAKGGGGGGYDGTTGLGGLAVNGFGAIKHSGGNGNGLDTTFGGGGGGGAAGPSGAGRSGGRNLQAGWCAGGGGGGGGGGTAGSNADNIGGTGGNGPAGTGGATGSSTANGPPGWAGGGGAGGATSPSGCSTGPTYSGGAGGNGVEFGSEGGAGGGGGGGGGADDTNGGAGGAGGLFGGGGGAGGSRFNSAGSGGAGGGGGSGLILIKYTPASTTGLVHHYKLDETSGTSIIDYGSASPLNGTFNGGANVVSEPNSPATTGLVFDGSNDYIDIGSGSDFESLPMTVSIWFKIDTLPTVRTTYDRVLRKAHDAAANWIAWDLQMSAFNDKFVWNINNASNSVSTMSSDNTVVVGRWYHTAMTIDSSGNAKMYVDGILQAQTATPGSIFNADGPLRVGANYSGGDSFDGALDDLRIYNRVLTSNEIKSLYDTSKPIQFIQQTNFLKNSTNASHTVTFPSLPRAGNTVIAYFATWLNGVHDVRDTAVTDNHGNRYYQACKRVYSPGSHYLTGIWYAKNIKLSSPSTYTVTVTPTVSTEGLLRATEYAGLSSVSPLDKNASNTSTGGSPALSGTTATTTTANQMLATVVGFDSGSMTTITTPTNWTDRGRSVSGGTNPFGGFADRIVYATGAQSASWPFSPNTGYSACIATFAQSSIVQNCPGGYESGGYCYYDGAINADCVSTCAFYGKSCSLAGTQAASASDATCQGILTGLGRQPDAVTTGAYLYGCSILQSSNAVRRHTTTTSVTCTDVDTTRNRVCACE